MTKKIKELKSVYVGLTQAIIASLYITLVVFFISFGEVAFGKINKTYGPFLVLTLLVLSVLFLFLVLFGYPILLAKDGKVKKSLKIISFSFLWLLLIFIIFLVFLVNTPSVGGL